MERRRQSARAEGPLSQTFDLRIGCHSASVQSGHGQAMHLALVAERVKFATGEGPLWVPNSCAASGRIRTLEQTRYPPVTDFDLFPNNIPMFKEYKLLSHHARPAASPRNCITRSSTPSTPCCPRRSTTRPRRYTPETSPPSPKTPRCCRSTPMRPTSQRNASPPAPRPRKCCASFANTPMTSG